MTTFSPTYVILYSILYFTSDMATRSVHFLRPSKVLCVTTKQDVKSKKIQRKIFLQKIFGAAI